MAKKEEGQVNFQKLNKGQVDAVHQESERGVFFFFLETFVSTLLLLLFPVTPIQAGGLEFGKLRLYALSWRFLVLALVRGCWASPGCPGRHWFRH